MKFLSRSIGKERLQSAKDALRSTIVSTYEGRAKDCGSCETPGACCLDEHFVNVRISRLEAELINTYLSTLAPARQLVVRSRISECLQKYGLSSDGGEQTYACPLFELGSGCLVHNAGKPAPCISHACYERKEDLPPDRLLEACEIEIDDINTRVYGRPQVWMPIPVALTEHHQSPED